MTIVMDEQEKVKTSLKEIEFFAFAPTAAIQEWQILKCDITSTTEGVWPAA